MEKSKTAPSNQTLLKRARLEISFLLRRWAAPFILGDTDSSEKVAPIKNEFETVKPSIFEPLKSAASATPCEKVAPLRSALLKSAPETLARPK